MSNEYTLKGIIGEGAFATIWECEHVSTTKEYAMKIVKQNSESSSTEESDEEMFFRRESDLMKQLEHPNIIKFIDFIDNKPFLGIVMELSTDGDLFDEIVHGDPMNELSSREISHNIVSAIEYLSSLSVVHRDIKLENFLIFENGDQPIIKLGDFGLAEKLTGKLKELCGSPSYVAPEVLGRKEYGIEVDIWSTGVIIFAVVSQCLPFSGKTRKDLFQSILKGKYDFNMQQWDDKSDEVKDLIHKMLQVDVQERINAKEVLAHPWFKIKLSEQENQKEKKSKQNKIGLKTTAKIVGTVIDLHHKVVEIQREKALRACEMINDLKLEEI